MSNRRLGFQMFRATGLIYNERQQGKLSYVIDCQESGIVCESLWPLKSDGVMAWGQGKAWSTHLVGLLTAEHYYFRCNLWKRSMEHVLPLTSIFNCSYTSPRLAASPCNAEGDSSAWILLVVALTLETLPTFRGDVNSSPWFQASAIGHCPEAQKFLTNDTPRHKNIINSEDKAPRNLYLGEIWRLSVQLYIPAALHKEERSPASAGQVVWAPEYFWTWGLQQNFYRCWQLKTVCKLVAWNFTEWAPRLLLNANISQKTQYVQV